MKKTVSALALLLALTACGGGPEQLSTEETCSEAMAIVTAAGGGDATDEQLEEVSDQLDDLADRASDPLKDELETLSDAIGKGREAFGSMDAETESAFDTVSEVCNF